jgi:membrane-bound serine protease (ClpP class)
MAHILVIDDERSIRNTLKEILEYEKFTVDLAENGSEGLEKYREDKYDIVLCDIKMPEMDGLEVLEKIFQEEGDAQVIMQTVEGFEEAPEKMVSVYRSDWKKASAAKDRSFALARGFFEIDHEVIQVGVPENFSFMLREDYDNLAESERPPIMATIVKEGELLTLFAEEARDLGIGVVVPDFDAYLASIGATADDIDRGDMSISQQALRYLGANPWIYILLVIIGLNGLYTELKAPGFGIPGLTAVVCFTIVLGARYFLGSADTAELILFGIGLLLCAVEIFVLPGFGVAGISGLIMMLGSLVVANLPDLEGIPTPDRKWVMLGSAAMDTLAGFVLSLVTIAVIFPLLVNLPQAQRRLLPNEMRNEDGFVVDTVSEQGDLVGLTGVAKGGLRPTGRMLADDGRMLEVSSDGGFLDEGQRVRVHHVDGNRIVVRPLREA